jgi:hypothetical protein
MANEVPKSKRKQAVPNEETILKSLEKVREVIRHKTNVLDACILLGERLIENGEIDLGRQLIAHGYEHDCSKFNGIEYDYLSKFELVSKDDETKLGLAVGHHNRTNKHHPEFWGPAKDGSIKKMSRVFIAEMVCDWKARSGEMGLGLVDWVEKEAKKRFAFTKRDSVYAEIMFFVGLLLNKKFEPIAGHQAPAE